MQPIPTVRVKTDAVDNPDGFIVINESDFDEKAHQLHVGPLVATTPNPTIASKPVDRKSIGELRVYLEEKGIAYSPDAKRAELQALYDADTGA